MTSRLFWKALHSSLHTLRLRHRIRLRFGCPWEDQCRSKIRLKLTRSNIGGLAYIGECQIHQYWFRVTSKGPLGPDSVLICGYRLRSANQREAGGSPYMNVKISKCPGCSTVHSWYEYHYAGEYNETRGLCRKCGIRFASKSGLFPGQPYEKWFAGDGSFMDRPEPAA